MILIAYDGSEDAKAALAAAARLFPGQEVTIVTVWQRFVDTMARAGTGMVLMTDYDEIDGSAEQGATATAVAGAELASADGLIAQGKSAVVDTSVAEALLREADALGADAIVLGTRGLTGVKSLMMGSTSHHVLQHADRPVMVIPSPAIAAERAKHLAGE